MFLSTLLPRVHHPWTYEKVEVASVKERLKGTQLSNHCVKILSKCYFSRQLLVDCQVQSQQSPSSSASLPLKLYRLLDISQLHQVDAHLLLSTQPCFILAIPEKMPSLQHHQLRTYLWLHISCCEHELNCESWSVNYPHFVHVHNTCYYSTLQTYPSYMHLFMANSQVYSSRRAGCFPFFRAAVATITDCCF